MTMFILAAAAVLTQSPAGDLTSGTASVAVHARARANLASYIRPGDYPAEALKNSEQGTVRFRLSVNAKGRVEGCAITASSGSPSLDAASCRIVTTRARFEPAVDSEGKPTSDYIESKLAWTLFR